MQQQTHLTSNKIPRQPKKYGNRSCFARLKKNFILKCLTTTGVPEIEVRGKAKEGIGRVLYCTVIGSKIIVLHAFVKKTQKTPKKDIDLAVSRFKELKNENLS
ncbi:type II toxin-antitoxin system RelE/ParE family toxin [Parasutterella excrementihominis]|uniref:type II toxin-antitoxin system RelE/ParE family toxin n=1 Tax=Parasutterella excrementihominis TaxID=487175 RepID=UPI003522FE78